MAMYIFWLISLIMANGYRHSVAIAAAQQAQHAAHVRHIEHVNYMAFLTRPVLSISQPIGPVAIQPQPPKTIVASPQPTVAPTYVHAGNYSCSSLESLWVSAGGNPASEFIAAQIATAESGGNPDAISPTDDYGLWQINASNAPGSEMLNPWANVKEAIALSDNGRNWSPWTTFTSGIYSSEC